MQVRFYQAECGDAARIHYIGVDNKPHNIFIDSGYVRTFRHVLVDEILNIKKEGESIDLWIISHIHDDHIGGALAYINAIKDGEFTDIVQSWFYNPPRRSTKGLTPEVANYISEAKSIGQGDTLASYLISTSKLPVADITNNHSQIDLFGLKVTILSPDVSQLQQLRNKYSDLDMKPFEKNEIDSISEATAARRNDYNSHLESFNLATWQEDDSLENGSSISLLTEFKSRRILWLADAHPNTVITVLKNMGYSKYNPLRCDWVKVSHHGSTGNNSNELYEMVRCENYLISANGKNRSNLPSKEFIARILLNNQRILDSHYKFYFTYDNEILRSMFAADGDAIFSKLRFSVFYNHVSSKMIEVKI